MRNHLDEQELVEAAKNGDQSAFGSLVQLHQRRMYGIARAIVSVHEDAEDAVQDAFIRAYNALDRFNSGQAFGAWLNRIVANSALDIARRRKIRTTEQLHDSIATHFQDPGVIAELNQRLKQALSELPERMRSVLVLHDVQGFPHAEIGSLLNIPEGTSRSDLHHARKRLKISLQDLKE